MSRGDRRVVIVVIAAVAVVVASCAWLFFTFLYTPTTTITVHNDTNFRVELANCSSDSPTLDPGQTGSIDPNTDAIAYCIVYQNDGGHVLGCLRVATSGAQYRNSVEINDYVRGTTAAACGR